MVQNLPGAYRGNGSVKYDLLELLTSFEDAIGSSEQIDHTNRDELLAMITELRASLWSGSDGIKIMKQWYRELDGANQVRRAYGMTPEFVGDLHALIRRILNESKSGRTRDIEKVIHIDDVGPPNRAYPLKAPDEIYVDHVTQSSKAKFINGLRNLLERIKKRSNK